MKNYLVRERVVDTIRQFFKSQGFHEVFTPIMVPIPSSEPNLEVFETQLRTNRGNKRQAFLITSPEYSIKKLLAAGMGNCFEITKSFRNEEDVSPQHNSEFTILEWYRVGANYKNIMEDFQNLVLKITGKNTLRYQNVDYDLTPPWQKISVLEAFNGKIPDPDDFSQAFFNEVEPRLTALKRPVIVYDYPKYQASLAKINKDGFAERFEVFLAGLELGNCFTELTDWKEQEDRCKKDILERQKLNKTSYPVDNVFIDALKSGLPAVAGIAVGVDRLIMLFADVPTVADTI